MIIEVSFEYERKQRRELPRKGGGVPEVNTGSSDPFALSPLKTPKKATDLNDNFKCLRIRAVNSHVQTRSVIKVSQVNR